MDTVTESYVWSAANDKTSGSLDPVQQDSQNSFMLLSVMPAMAPKVGHSRVPPITAGQHFQVSLMLLCDCQTAQKVSPELQFMKIIYLI